MKKVVTFGEIMLRLTTERFLRFSQSKSFNAMYGGGEFNVAVSLANLGIPSEFVTRLPTNEIGECALMEMHARDSVCSEGLLRAARIKPGKCAQRYQRIPGGGQQGLQKAVASAPPG